MNEISQDLKELQAAWLRAKEEEDRAKQARLVCEGLILDSIGWTEGDPNFKGWKDDVKITFGSKEEYDNAALMEAIPVDFWKNPEFPFRIKLEPDAKKMTEFKVKHNAFYFDKLAPLCKIKFAKPSFANNIKE